MNVLKRFGDTQNIGVKSIDYKEPGEIQIVKEVRFTGSCYEVALPWKDKIPVIDDNYDICNNRLRLL